MSVWTRNYSFDARQCGPVGNASWVKDGNPVTVTPALRSGDSLTVAVTWASSNPQPPGSLSAYAIIGASQQGSNPAGDVTPFGSQAQPIVFASQTISGNGIYTFSLGFNNARVPASGTRQYELTVAFVSGANQWEEDPEFDTSGG